MKILSGEKQTVWSIFCEYFLGVVFLNLSCANHGSDCCEALWPTALSNLKCAIRVDEMCQALGLQCFGKSAVVLDCYAEHFSEVLWAKGLVQIAAKNRSLQVKMGLNLF